MYPQIPAFILGFLATASVITTTFWNQWSVSGPTSSGVLGPIWAWRSLFGECMQYQGGQSQCQGQNSMFLMPGRKLAIRGMMITSIILSTLACFGTMVGGEYSKVLDDKKNMKRKVMFICGFAYFLSGILTLTSVAWYTGIVYSDFFKYENQDNYIQWELGACIYLGYIACVLCILAFIACVCCPGPVVDSKNRSKNFYYKPKYYDVKTSRDDVQSRGLLKQYKSHRTKKRTEPGFNSSTNSSKSCKKIANKSSESGNSSSQPSRSFSRAKTSKSSRSTDSGCTSDTYRYPEYV